MPPFYSDPLFLSAHAEVESSGRADAIGPETKYGTAKGLHQFIDSTWEQYGNGGDVFDPEANSAAAVRYFGDLDEMFGGDPRLMMAGYNYGQGNVQRLQNEYGDSYEDIEPHLPAETRNYVPSVLGKYERNRAQNGQPQEGVPQPERGQEYQATPQGFASALLDEMAQPGFDDLPYSDKAGILHEIYQSKRWGNDSYDILKEVMSNLANGSNKDELPNISEILDPPPVIEKDPEKELAAWREDQMQKLLREKISPAIFGKDLDNYFERVTKDEAQAFEIRNRGFFSSIISTPFNIVRDTVKGAASVVTKPIAGAVRLTYDFETADAIESLPEYLGTPANDYLYVTDDNGRVVYNKDGTPQTRWMSDISQGIGQIGGMLAGGYAMKGLGYATTTVGGTFFGVNALTGANDNFKEVLEATGDQRNAYAASLYALPAAALGSIAELAVVSKIANPAIPFLSDFNKAKYLGSVFARNAAIGGAGNAAFDYTLQLGKVRNAGGEIDTGRLAQATLIGAIPSGGIAAFQARNVRGIPDPNPYADMDSADPFQMGPQEGSFRQEKMNLPAVRPNTLPSTETAPPQLPRRPRKGIADIDPTTLEEVTRRLEAFQRSEASQLQLTAQQADAIPTEFFELFGLGHAVNGDTVVLTKKESFIPRDAETITDLDNTIAALQKELIDTPSPDSLPALVEKRSELKREAYGQGEAVNQETVRRVRQRAALQREFDNRKAVTQEQKDALLKKVAYLEQKEAADALAAFDAANDDFQYLKKIGDIEDQIRTINEQIIQAQSGTYLNDIKARERNLNNLIRKRRALQAEQIEKALQADAANLEAQALTRKKTYEAIGATPQDTVSPDVGLTIEGRSVIPHNNKWYVFEPNGDVRGVADYYSDAVKIAKPTAPEVVAAIEAEAREAGAIRMKEEQEAISRGLAEREASGEQPLFTDVKPGSQLAKDIASGKALKPGKPARTKKAKKGSSRKPVPGTLSLTEDTTVEPSPAGGTLKVGPDGEQVFSSQPISVRTMDATRLRYSREKKPLTSNYTKPVVFAEDSTKVVKPAEATGRAQKVVSAISKDTKIFFGGGVSRGARGFLNFGRDYIKVGQFGDLPTTFHEAGHAIDRALISKWDNRGVPDYSNVPQNVQEALRDMADTYYNFSEPPSDILRTQEGVSTFFQHYLTGQPVRQEVLDWYNSAFKEQWPSTYKQLEELKGVAYDYFNQTPEAATQALIDEKPGYLSRLGKYWTTPNLMDKWVNDHQIYRDINRVSGNTKVGDTAEAFRGQAQRQTDFLVKRGLVDSDGNSVEGMSLLEAISPAKGKEKELQAYLVNKRRGAIMKQGINPGGNASDIFREIDRVERTEPDVLRAAQNYYNFMDHVLDMVRDGSSEGAYVVAKIRENNIKATGTTHGYYVPFERAGNGGFNPLKAVKGSTRSVVSPLENIENAVEALLTKSNSSKLREAILEQVSNNAPFNSSGLYVREVTGAQRIGIEAELKKQLPADATKEEALLASFGMDPLAGVSSSEFKVIPMFDGNRLRFFEVDPRLYTAMNPELPAIMNNPLMKYVFRPSAQIFRPLATTLRPAFVVKNLLRDSLTAYRYVNTGEGNFKDMLNLAQALHNSFWDTTFYKGGSAPKGWAAAIDRMGINNSTRFAETRDIRDQLQKKWGKNFLDFGDKTLSQIESVMSIPEEAIRQAVMRLEARRLGITDPNQKLTSQQMIELALAYKRGTTNFQNQGSQARAINMAVPFFTARIAEMSRLPSDLKRNPKKFAAIASSMLGFGIYNAVANKDKEWYQELTPQARASAFWTTGVFGGVEKLLYIPMDTVSQLGWGLGQMIGTKMTEDPKMPVAYYELATAYLGQHAPLSNRYEIFGPVLKELIQQDNNRDYYFGKDIIPPNLRYHDPKYQYNEYTTELAKNVGNIMGWSPMRIDHAIRSTMPAVSDAISFTEKVTGVKKQKEFQGLSWVTAAFSRAGSSAGQMDRSRQQFTENLIKFRANKPEESTEEGQVRKQLEKINRQVSDLNTVILGVDDQKMRDELRAKQRELLRLGNVISTGSGQKAPPLKESSQAARIRKQRDRQLKESAAEKRKNDAAYSLLGETDGVD